MQIVPLKIIEDFHQIEPPNGLWRLKVKYNGIKYFIISDIYHPNTTVIDWDIYAIHKEHNLYLSTFTCSKHEVIGILPSILK